MLTSEVAEFGESDLRRRDERALIVRMKTTTNATLYMDAGGEIECDEHAPYPGSDTRVLGGWQPITKREAIAFEREVGRAPACETCQAIARRANGNQ